MSHPLVAKEQFTLPYPTVPGLTETSIRVFSGSKEGNWICSAFGAPARGCALGPTFSNAIFGLAVTASLLLELKHRCFGSSLSDS